MNQRPTYFSVHWIPYAGNKSPTHRVLVLLDIQQTTISHAALLELLSLQYEVVCLEMTNQSSKSGVFHWDPSLPELKYELAQIGEDITSVHCCIAQGFAATLLQYIPVSRVKDILGNPTLPSKDIRFIQLLSRFLWSSTHTSQWFTRLIETSWKEQLQWPLQGSAPWVSRLPTEQDQYTGTITNGTWKQIFRRILDTHEQANPMNIIVFLGSESSVISSTSPSNLHCYYSSSTVRYRVFCGLRQELLLNEVVQRDILQVCEELL